MRFVLLGDDPDGIALLQAVDQSPEHVIAAAVGIGSPEVLSRLSPDVERFDDWRRVLTVADVDAALVATSDPDLLTGARQLASRGRLWQSSPVGARTRPSPTNWPLSRTSAPSRSCRCSAT